MLGNEITISGDEVTLLMKLVELYDESYDAEQDPEAGRGRIEPEAIAKAVGCWDEEETAPQPRFDRMIRYLSRAGVIETISRQGASSLYFPSNQAISIVRGIKKDEQIPKRTKLWDYLKKHLMKSADQSIQLRRNSSTSSCRSSSPCSVGS